MREIPIYAAEREAGLQDAIRTTARISFASLAEVVETCKLSEKVLARISHYTKATNKGQPDLHYFKSILVTTGWNKNDDVFDPYETWAARHSPEDKPVNYEHNQDDILGHMTGSYVIGADSVVVDDAVAFDDVPGKFHIVTSGVLYKEWEDEKLKERIDKIIAETAKGEWFVSMEALFNDFGYAIIEGDTAKVVARNKETAFLTKHLRAYGGTGKYGNARVGRLLKNIVFSGKGYVRKPANPESIILTDSEDFDSTQADILQTFEQLGYENMSKANIKESNKMATENTIEILQAQVAELTAAKTKLEVTLQETNVKEIKAKAETLENTVKEKDAKIATLETEVKAKSDESVATKAKLDEVTKAHKEVSDKLAQIEADKKRADRISAVASKLDLAKDKAEKLVDKLAGLNDEAFAAAVDTQVEMKTEAMAKVQKTETVVTTEKKDEGKEVDDKGEKVVANTSVENVEVKNEVALAAETVNAGVKNVAEQIAARYTKVKAK